jgi:hypothetical protein
MPHENKSFYMVKNAIPAEMSKLIYQYAIFDQIKTGRVGDHQVPTAHGKYADPLMESLLLLVQPIIEKTTGLSLYPTYAYYRIYRRGDILKPHYDRPSCEISASLCIGHNYENYEWPLFVDDSKIILEPTDLAIYKGLDSLHWRDEFLGPHNAVQVQAFLHYVDENGPYQEYKYDGRPAVGFPSSSKRIID